MGAKIVMNRLGMALGLVALVALVATLLFERFSHFDYKSGICSAGGVQLEAQLNGSFEKNHPSERSAPYYLRLAVSSKADGDGRVNVRDLALRSLVSGKVFELETSSMHELGHGKLAYLVQDIAVPFENYELTGQLVQDSPLDGVPFTCYLQKNFSQEWRMPLWDMLTSV